MRSVALRGSTRLVRTGGLGLACERIHELSRMSGPRGTRVAFSPRIGTYVPGRLPDDHQTTPPWTLPALASPAWPGACARAASQERLQPSQVNRSSARPLGKG